MNANAPRFTHDVDHNIDRALAGVRDAQPRSGLKGRILASLEERSTAPQPARMAFSARLALWAATSAAIIAVSSLLILQHHRRAAAVPVQSAQSTTHSNTPESAQLRVPRVPILGPAVESPRASTEPAHRMSHRSTMPASCSQPGCPIHDDAVVMGEETRTSADLDAQALADLHAPSHPAPPLPLTPQEKLFRRMIQYGNATQLAELDPIVRAKENADETTAFKAFFPDPPPLEQPNGDTE